MKNRQFGAGLFYFIVGLVLIGSGCTVKNRGTPHENTAPKVFFSAVPIVGTVFTKPEQLFWFATDRDGYIVEFQYVLIPDSVVGVLTVPESQRDAKIRTFLNRNRPTGSGIWQVYDSLRNDTLQFTWISVDNVQRNGQTDTVALPTSRRDTVTVHSVVFVRARDDKEMLSTDSRNYPDSNSIAWRNFGRKNRPPRAHFKSIGVCNRFPIFQVTEVPTFFSLDRPTYNANALYRVGHCGITIEWEGSDSLDYPNQPQPPFDYFWELFGPFPNRFSAAPDTNRLWASTAYPVRWPGRPDTASPSRMAFTSARSVTFYGLRGFDTLSNFRLGYYFFRVRTRDDAGVLTATAQAATNTFAIVHPRFDRNILLISKVTPKGGTATQKNGEPDASPPVADSLAVQNFYLRLIRNAGYAGKIDSAQDVKFIHTDSLIPESLLARYRLVIFHKERAFPTILVPTNFLSSIKAYMDAGGSVWGMGRDDLSDLNPIFTTPEAAELPFDLFEPAFGVGYFYFGMQEMFYHAHSLKLAKDSITREEFVGADLGPKGAGFPTLDIDTNVIKGFTVAAPPRKDTSRYRRYPGVNYFVTGTTNENLYLFRSPVGIADTSHLNGKVVASRSDRLTFKTSYFGFPLYGIKENQATEVTRLMLEWFIGPP